MYGPKGIRMSPHVKGDTGDIGVRRDTAGFSDVRSDPFHVQGFGATQEVRF